MTVHSTERPSPAWGRDPTWLLVLRAVALVLAIVLMALTLLGGFALWQRTQEVGDLFEDSSTSEPAEPTEEFVPEPGAGQSGTDWYKTNPDGTESYCYETVDPVETICEPTGN